MEYNFCFQLNQRGSKYGGVLCQFFVVFLTAFSYGNRKQILSTIFYDSSCVFNQAHKSKGWKIYRDRAFNFAAARKGKCISNTFNLSVLVSVVLGCSMFDDILGELQFVSVCSGEKKGGVHLELWTTVWASPAKCYPERSFVQAEGHKCLFLVDL